MELGKQAVDVGVVAADAERSLRFYGEVLGLRNLGSVPLPIGGVMLRMACGDSVVKVMVPDEPATAGRRPPAAGPLDDMRSVVEQACRRGGISFLTVQVMNLEQVVDACRASADCLVLYVGSPRRRVEVAIVEDPDGNWIELVEYPPRAAAGA